MIQRLLHQNISNRWTEFSLFRLQNALSLDKHHRQKSKPQLLEQTYGARQDKVSDVGYYTMLDHNSSVLSSVTRIVAEARNIDYHV